MRGTRCRDAMICVCTVRTAFICAICVRNIVIRNLSFVIVRWRSSNKSTTKQINISTIQYLNALRNIRAVSLT